MNTRPQTPPEPYPVTSMTGNELAIEADTLRRMKALLPAGVASLEAIDRHIAARLLDIEAEDQRRLTAPRKSK